jgi:hypothetical protein
MLVTVACGTADADAPLAPTGPTGRIRFTNVITDTTRGRVNAILEGVVFGVNLTYTQSTPITLAAPSTAPYAAVLAGARTLVLKRTADTNTIVATVNLTIDAGQDHSVYATGGSAASAIVGLVTSDVNTAPAAGQVRLRVVNLSPTAGAVDVFVTAANADLAAATPAVVNLAHRAASQYFALAAGTYQLRTVPTGTAPAARAAAVNINLAGQVLSALSARTFVLADNTTGGTPLRAFALIDR